MIKREIKVPYHLRLSDDKVCLTDEELVAGSGQTNPDRVAALPRTVIFHLFKNNGELSRRQRPLMATIPATDRDRLINKAEAKLADLLALEDETETDMTRAISLAQKVNQAARELDFAPVLEVNCGDDFQADDDAMVTIKERTSRASWYQGAGFGHSRSRYLTRVPRNVEHEARELQAIRRKHQNDPTFDFWKTGYDTQEVRIADHFN